MRNLEHVKHVIIKIGSTSLCNGGGQLDKERILKLIQQIAILKRKGLKVTLVSSGAISSGMGVLNLSEKPKEISKKQALAAIGQAHLMQIYEDLFSLFHLKCAQILLNHDDFDHRKRLMNLSYALSSILDYDVTFFDILSTKAKQFGFTMHLKNGKKFTCAGDEPYNPECKPYVEGSQWLLHEAFCLYGDRERFQPYEKHHSTVKEACELAESLSIPNLVLWHTEDKNLSHRKELYTAEGKEYYHGNLLVPDDGEIIEL